MDAAPLAARLSLPQVTVPTRTSKNDSDSGSNSENEGPALHARQRKIHEAQSPQPAVVAVAVPMVTPQPRQVETPASIALHGTAAVTQVSDPTYYGARSLDVYPQAITALILTASANTGAAGKVRATVLIDESGTVNEVRGIETVAAEIGDAARDLLLRTRFTPASKDGRVVKAQLLLSVDYGAQSAP